MEKNHKKRRIGRDLRRVGIHITIFVAVLISAFLYLLLYPFSQHGVRTPEGARKTLIYGIQYAEEQYFTENSKYADPSSLEEPSTRVPFEDPITGKNFEFYISTDKQKYLLRMVDSDETLYECDQLKCSTYSKVNTWLLSEF